MKKILLTLAVVLAAAFSANAQVKSDAAIQKAVDKAVAASQNPKKAGKVATWLSLGKAYEAAYNNPIANIMMGFSEQELSLTMGNDKPLSQEMVVLGGAQYKKNVYAQKDVYFDPATGGIVFYVITKPSVEGDALGEAYKAYVKAHELDPAGKKDKDIAAAIERIAKAYYQDAYAQYLLGNYAGASKLFEKAGKVAATAPCVSTDYEDAIYNAALTAQETGDFLRATALYNKSISQGYSAEGNAYSNLGTIALTQKDTLTARKHMEEGFDHYPENPAILTSLINLYLQINEDPRLILERLEMAKAKMPDNTSLYNVQGNLLAKLGDDDAALEAFRSVLKINPNDPTGLCNEGVFWFQKGLQLQQEANDLPYSEYRKYDAMMAEMHELIKKGIEPFERAFEMCGDREEYSNYKIACAENLKQMYFILRNDDPVYKAGYEKYEAFLAQ